MSYARGPGRIKLEIEGVNLWVVLKDGELRVGGVTSEGRTWVEKARPTYVHLETWTRELDLEWPEEGPPR